MRTDLLMVFVVWSGLLSPLRGDEFATLQKPFQAYCIGCHGADGTVEGGVNLADLRSDKDLLSRPDLLEELIDVLRDHRMPPQDEPTFSRTDRSQLIAKLQLMLNESLRAYPFEPSPIRRMNRFQYNNAVVDLLELDRDIFQLNERLIRRRDDYFHPETRKMPPQVRISCRPLSKDIDNQRPEGFNGVAAFPQDQRAEHGFDNRSDHLTLSPLLMESFLELSETIVMSPDLNPRECRSWNRIFAPPDTLSGGRVEAEIEDQVRIVEKPNAEASTEDASATEAIRTRLASLLRRAFRRPVDQETLNRFTRFAEKQLHAGASHEETMRTVVGAILAMPEFLYFYEAMGSDEDKDGNPGRQPISDFELASRLSQFFWSSIPDDTLLDLAEAGKLQDPEMLGQQIDRMMNDRKSSRFCDNFPSQWLQLDRLITSIPDREQFPYFYYAGYRTSMHMMPEPLLVFETVYVEDRSILDLIAPDFTWQSDMLGQNYEGKSKSGQDVQVQTVKRVSLEDPRRGGVITNAAVMTMTSTPTRTQPITRGAWLNEVIFNDPPEPPPADVPPLPEADHEALAKLTIRERLAAHRERADCAGCHNQIDPLGFALENFGPTGVWRDTYENGREVDPSGRLFNQYDFKSVVEFKSLLLQEKQRFIRAFTAHLMSYALARELGPADSPALDKITEEALAGNDHMRSILKGVAMSEPFLHKSRLPTQETRPNER